MVKCPFNPLHIMTESSLQRHIIRCMVNYPNYVTCPYNALHRFPNKDLLAKHMLNCEAKTNSYLFQELKDSITTDVHPDNIRDFNMALENWDA